MVKVCWFQLPRALAREQKTWSLVALALVQTALKETNLIMPEAQLGDIQCQLFSENRLGRSTCWKIVKFSGG